MTQDYVTPAKTSGKTKIRNIVRVTQFHIMHMHQ